MSSQIKRILIVGAGMAVATIANNCQQLPTIMKFLHDFRLVLFYMKFQPAAKITKDDDGSFLTN